MPGEGTPRSLSPLFQDTSPDPAIGVGLPNGGLVAPRRHETPAYWLSDGPVSPDLWASLRRVHEKSGLWPVLIRPSRPGDYTPWTTGEVCPEPVAEIGRRDVGAILRDLWTDRAAGIAGDSEFRELAPYGRDWPGLAVAVGGAGLLRQDAGEAADKFVLENDDGTSRIMLIPAIRSADVVTAMGWRGPAGLTRTSVASLSAVVRSWEERFGVRLVQVGFDSMFLTVANPPVTQEHAERVAAEHFAFCPDNIIQGPGTIGRYAAKIRRLPCWGFFWG